MVLFKVSGERNSGTHFLEEILRKNKFPTHVNEYNGNIAKLWKHGIPIEDNKLLDDKVIDIFIFRELGEWLTSMYYNVYNLKTPPGDFNNFLTLKQEATEIELDFKTNKVVNEDDNNKTIFEIRYYKFKKIMEYRKNNKSIILVNLKFLQNKKNMSDFLQQLNDKYMNNSIDNNYITEIPHTKDFSCSINRKYDVEIDDYKDIINTHKNEEIETFINNITIWFEQKAYGVCAWWGNKLGIKSNTIRMYFIYLSFFTAGSPIILYFVMKLNLFLILF
jgi:phage shock protein PspC (stress-responsive transcriptional regulator)